MKITDNRLSVKQIKDVTKSTIPRPYVVCDSRYSDCFAFVLSGKATYRFGRKTIVAEAGDIVYLSHRSKYTITIENCDFTTIFVDFFFDNADGTILENNIFKGNRIKNLENTFIKLRKLWTIGNFSDKIYAYSLLYRIYSDIVLDGLFAYMPTSRKLQLENAITLISEKYSSSDFSIKHLANSCNISEAHFRRLFMQVYHTSPKKFITSYRLDKAKQMLKEFDFSISEICEKCGFENAYYFTRVFKANTGMTPSEYRKNQTL
ncbi:MAG: helix-turn-helix domain-containing protein [Clostridia bacterium]|nr:helix-turn-helix domain-containing protein [Clostridia bacterium]